MVLLPDYKAQKQAAADARFKALSVSGNPCHPGFESSSISIFEYLLRQGSKIPMMSGSPWRSHMMALDHLTNQGVSVWRVRERAYCIATGGATDAEMQWRIDDSKYSDSIKSTIFQSLLASFYFPEPPVSAACKLLGAAAVLCLLRPVPLADLNLKLPARNLMTTW